MHPNQAVYLCLMTLMAFSGCNSSDFSSGGAANKAPVSAHAPKNPDVIQPGEPIPTTCPKTAQHILIIDLKSGWWAGDGSNFFDKIIGGISNECVGAVQIEYHHILSEDNESGIFPGGSLRRSNINNFDTMFAQRDWRQYTQIWLLSGSEADPDDLKTDDPLFEKILTATAASMARLFVGSGFGSISHANKLASALMPNVQFGTSQIQGEILSPGVDGLRIKSSLTKGSQLTEHALFNGVNSLADELYTRPFGAGETARSDFMTSTGSLTVIGRDQSGQAIIATGDLANRRHVVVDAGLQRYYAITQPTGGETLKFLQNILTYLAQP